MTNPGTFLPIALRLDDTKALVVGGGNVAANKLRLLLGRCPEICVLAADTCDEIQLWEEQGRLLVVKGQVTDALLEERIPQTRIVFAATDDRVLNRRVAQIARSFNVLVCVVDEPEPSSFITPALVDRHPVQVAISTGGAAPVLARRLRLQIEAMLPSGLGDTARFMHAQRPWIREALPDMLERKRAWEDFLDGPGYEASLGGDTDAARVCLEEAITRTSCTGEAWLVGAGPGDPDLLTLGALRLMQNADSVLYDHLVPAEILDRVRRDADRVFVGKRRSHHTLPQDEINAEIIRRAKRGERVLRLKGGDPFIFGRGGEEMEALVDADIPVRIIPGITAASGCGAAAGIPLTHRDCAQSCLFLTGHARTDGTLDLHWPSLARKGQTLAIYMGLAPLGELACQLIAHGLPPDWPAAIIEKGTRADQRVIVGTLETLADLASSAELRGPALTIVGEVVKHRRDLRNVTVAVTAAQSPLAVHQEIS
ncbi:uroporphyrinogen-III C-methyltransferase [Gluconobacter wancherniae]|uniref:Siroheme synthase n=2 Tax=Gluconobacter wancherniae TaxID=1307955 RepID=A0A511BA55_9PROT|nr:uroporphyrinogen-III C-methyltransferase [Gluconobacter wancherniae]GBD58002.1 siroheme synthase 2 [Gluconobacter wancherniae NBRC 103581]GBR65639.1 siroheme synthase [Gluconobacter wancherniae NBRC 103581]GEK94707.1 siroheme synthase [Gluconobacter wancherniae NBRC 103581]